MCESLTIIYIYIYIILKYINLCLYKDSIQRYCWDDQLHDFSIEPGWRGADPNLVKSSSAWASQWLKISLFLDYGETALKVGSPWFSKSWYKDVILKFSCVDFYIFDAFPLPRCITSWNTPALKPKWRRRLPRLCEGPLSRCFLVYFTDVTQCPVQ